MSKKIKYDPLFTKEEVQQMKSDVFKSIIKKAMEYQQAHDYHLAGQLASTEALLLDQLSDIEQVEKAYNEMLS